MHNSDEIRTRISNSNTNKIIVDTDGTNLRDGKWHHVVMTYDGTSSASGVSVYIDGVISSMKAPIDDTLSASITNNLPLVLGNKNPTAPGFLDGTMDDIRIYDYELTGGEISNLFLIP